MRVPAESSSYDHVAELDLSLRRKRTNAFVVELRAPRYRVLRVTARNELARAEL